MDMTTTPMQELVKEFEEIQKNNCKTAQEVVFFDGVLAIIQAKYLKKEQKALSNAYIKGATDYCKSSDGLETFLKKHEQ